jgi:probable poly-beta-1,6-N-acetyl-D-glucosamine export protein
LSNDRVIHIDKLRVIAIAGVVLIHTTTRILEKTSYDLNTYYLTLFLNQIVRFAVPLFFIISGFVLELTYKESFNFWVYIKKRFSKILIPYIFWSFIYYYFFYNSNHDNFLYVLLTGDASYQLYFIPTLVIFYLVFPLLHKIYKFISHPGVLASLAILQLCFLYQDYFIKNFQIPDPLRISILGFFFFTIGIISAHHKETLIDFSKKWKNLIMIFFVTLGFYIFREGFLQYQITYNINSFYSSWRPSTFIYSIISGILLLTMFDRFNFHKLSRLSFLVFFIHVIVLEIVWKFTGKFVSPNIYYDIFLFLSVCGISFVLAYYIHKIPHISKIVG